MLSALEASPIADFLINYPAARQPLHIGQYRPYAASDAGLRRPFADQAQPGGTDSPGWKTHPGPEHLTGIARDLVTSGLTEAVLISLGPDGAQLVTVDICGRISAPTVPLSSTAGAVDNQLAAIILKRAAGASWQNAACYSVTAGTATIVVESSELCRREDTERLYGWMTSDDTTEQVI